jgi:hypothetical protein
MRRHHNASSQERPALHRTGRDHAAAGRAIGFLPLNGIIHFSEFLVDGKLGAINPKQRE